MIYGPRRVLSAWVGVLLAIAVLLGSCSAPSPFPAGVSRLNTADLPPIMEGISWCSDGTHIVVGGYGGSAESVPKGELYLLDVTNGKHTTLIGQRGSGIHAHPSCSPDGKQVAFFSSVLKPEGIWAMNLSSKQLQFITSGDDPMWSPDGQRIAFTKHEGQYGKWTDTIYTLELGTGRITQVFSATAEIISLRSLSWSPNAERLAFSLGTGVLAKHLITETNIYAFDLVQSKLLQLTSGTENDYPKWSPDGRLIGYVSGIYSDPTLVIAKADGTCPVKPLKASGMLIWPAWSPDGTRIAFVGEREVYAMDVATVLGKDFLTTGPKCP